jgi:ATP-dependent Lon protease
MKKRNNIQETSEAQYSVIADISIPADQASEEIVLERTELIPILPLRNVVLFPGVFLTVNIGRQSSLKLVNEANKKGSLVGFFCQKDSNVEYPEWDDMHHIGSVGRILRVFEMPDQSITAVIQGMTRAELKGLIASPPYMRGNVEILKDEFPEKGDEEYATLLESCREAATKCIRSSEDARGNEAIFAMKNLGNTPAMIDFICANFPFKKDEKIEMLAISSLRDRAFCLLEKLTREVQLAELKESIQMRTREDIDQQQKEYFLQQQIRTIQNELGDGYEDEIEEMRAKAKKMKWNEETATLFDREVDKLERTNPQSPDYSLQLNYLETLLKLPWNVFTKDNLDMKNAEKTLNKDHYGLEKVKERILEHLAVLKLKGDMKSPIICLYGPPGVGKTSLGRSIANSLKRKYVRMSLGGVHDESEIRGHRRTYIGAMPGRIMNGLIKAESANPVFILDEIDKVFSDGHGDPSSALLEVLDPEQNTAFHDNYIDVDFDLSNVMFIATANNIAAIPAPLLDRMELIEVSGYITEEKIEIASKHLLPKELEENGMKKGAVKMSKETLETIIESYTRESGVRELDKKIGKILRKIARQYATDGRIKKRDIKPADLKEYLGTEEYSRDKYQGNEYAGVVTGLAWTAVGGEILFIETSLSRGKGSKLTLTGNLGDVMKESAVLALEYLKAHIDLLGIDIDVFDNWNIHIHVPEGAIPKDGPSAGITMATSLASALTQRKVKANLAMTGEITLRGKVLPVGGIREKILAAKRAGIKEIILCKENKKNIDEIPEMYLNGLTFHYVGDIKEVLDIALTDEKVDNAIDFTTKEAKK